MSFVIKKYVFGYLENKIKAIESKITSAKKKRSEAANAADILKTLKRAAEKLKKQIKKKINQNQREILVVPK